MLLGKPHGRGSCRQILQRLWLPNSREWIAQDSFDKIESTKCHVPFIGDPEAKVFPKFRMKHRGAHRQLFVGFVQPKLPPQFFERFRLQLPPLSSGERPKKPLGVLR